MELTKGAQDMMAIAKEWCLDDVALLRESKVQATIDEGNHWQKVMTLHVYQACDVLGIDANIFLYKVS